MDERFGKRYKLCSKKLIQEIFTKGSRLKKYPLLLRYIKTPENLGAPFQIAVSVPKRNIKQAAKRNRLKRQIREAVRKNKHIIEENITHSKSSYVLFITYSDRKLIDYEVIHEATRKLFHKLIESSDND